MKIFCYPAEILSDLCKHIIHFHGCFINVNINNNKLIKLKAVEDVLKLDDTEIKKIALKCSYNIEIEELLISNKITTYINRKKERKTKTF